jgi:transcriptional regulator with XRE-family HTH domain
MAATTRLDTLRMMLDMSMRQAALGAAIRQARIEKGMKQRQLAAQIPGRDGPVDTQTVSRWERGENVPDLDKLEVVAQVLGKPLSYFVAEEELPHDLQLELSDAVHQLAEVAPRLVAVADRLEALLDEQRPAQASRKPRQSG